MSGTPDMGGGVMSGSVVVTGCGTGLGRAIFERLITDGWAVVGLELDARERRMPARCRVPGMSSSVMRATGATCAGRASVRRASRRLVAGSTTQPCPSGQSP